MLKTPKILEQSKELPQENPHKFLRKANIFLRKCPKAQINSKNKPKKTANFHFLFGNDKKDYSASIPVYSVHVCK